MVGVLLTRALCSECYRPLVDDEEDICTECKECLKIVVIKGIKDHTTEFRKKLYKSQGAKSI